MTTIHLTSDQIEPITSLCDEMGWSYHEFIQKWGRRHRDALLRLRTRSEVESACNQIQATFDGCIDFDLTPEWRYFKAAAFLTQQPLSEILEKTALAAGLESPDRPRLRNWL